MVPIFVEPPTIKLPHVRRERGGRGVLTKSAKDPALSAPVDLGRRYALVMVRGVNGILRRRP